MAINLEKLDAVREYVRSSDDYTFELFLTSLGKISSYGRKGDELAGFCLFHPEKNPSASFNEYSGKWHCFSCNRGGDYIDLMRLTHHSGELSYSTCAESILKADKRMQLVLGFNSVQMYSDVVREFRPVRLGEKHSFNEMEVFSYYDLAKWCKRNGVNTEGYKMAILSAQSNIQIKDILRTLKSVDDDSSILYDGDFGDLDISDLV